MTESEASKKLKQHFEYLKHAWKPHPDYETMDAIGYAIQALEKQEKIKDLLDSCTAYPDDMCDCLVEIEKILRSDEDKKG